ncbi:uncharacterized protein LOC111075337 isoform X2 [Drosophila obscura]|uniref:uncharacterized protein LOC111075337 isoform X2 n=1 Tax=Drosophila obscura TaxID=7282 RepID=UPI001BB21540|nr:uncharacterized protein LOC111075337 isoform X2 [Drosophila obscura]
METTAVGIACCFQLLGVCFFFSPPEDHCSPAPTLASWLFLLATLCFLWDICIFPARYMHMSSNWQLLIETVMAIFFAELGAIVVWCPVERVLYGITEELLNMVGINGCEPSRWQYWLLGLLSTAAKPAAGLVNDELLPPHEQGGQVSGHQSLPIGHSETLFTKVLPSTGRGGGGRGRERVRRGRGL